MNVGLVDVDSHNFPNLVLMKLSAWHKSKGDTVYLLKPDDILKGVNLFTHYDRLYGACVFTENSGIAEQLEKNGVHTGGTGTSSKEVLPDEVEHMKPDYSLYGIPDTAYGFMTRGCPRHCPFCIVGDKEGLVSRKVADLSEWWDGQKNIKLLDPNLLACTEHENLLRQLVDSGAWVDVTQGMDARLLTERNIELINSMKIKTLHFAWDNPRDTKCKDALKMFSQKAMKHNTDYVKYKVYVLTNYWSTFEQDIYRVEWLRDNGYDPYVMVYDKKNAPREIRLLQRWVNNKRIFRTINSFTDYNCKIG